SRDDADGEVGEEEGAHRADRPEQLVEVGVHEGDRGERPREAGGDAGLVLVDDGRINLHAIYNQRLDRLVQMHGHRSLPGVKSERSMSSTVLSANPARKLMNR